MCLISEARLQWSVRVLWLMMHIAYMMSNARSARSNASISLLHSHSTPFILHLRHGKLWISIEFIGKDVASHLRTVIAQRTIHRHFTTFHFPSKSHSSAIFRGIPIKNRFQCIWIKTKKKKKKQTEWVPLLCTVGSRCTVHYNGTWLISQWNLAMRSLPFLSINFRFHKKKRTQNTWHPWAVAFIFMVSNASSSIRQSHSFDVMTHSLVAHIHEFTFYGRRRYIWFGSFNWPSGPRLL